MKIAFATQDQTRVDAHFGWARHLAVYEITPESYRHLQTHDFGDKLDADSDEDKLRPKLEAIGDCAILYVAAIGGAAAARIIAHNILPVRVQRPEPIRDLLERLQRVLRGTPPPWLRKALRKGKERPCDFDDDTDEVAPHG